MARFTALFTSFILLAASVSAAPVQHRKRIAQTTIDAPQKWRDACNAANGGEDCTNIAVSAAATLLAAAGVCDQQNSADQMIDLAKQLNNNQAMITAAQIFVQQPRNSPNSVATPYCQTAPKNAELNGLFQCQFQTANQQTFASGATVGQAGTIPFGLSAPLNPLGSCPANPSGPIPDGDQLSDLVSSPGSAAAVSTSSSSSGASSGKGSASGSKKTTTTAAAAAATTTAAATSSSSTTSSSTTSSSGFQAQNAKDAQALNAKFATLTASSACTDGDQACINGGFAQCVNGAFQISQCSGGTQCFALPLVNKAGTSITCDTASDAAARIAVTGVTGGVDGSGSGSSASSSSAATSAAAAAAPASASAATDAATSGSSSSSSSGFQAQNAKDAQALNAKFATLTASSSCTDGDQACINGGFAQCVNGAFQISQCSGGTQCFALPLVNKAGTSITCDTASDAAARIAVTGVSGGVDGSGASSSSAAVAPAANVAAAPTTTSTSSSSSAKGFQAQNAKDAQALNAQFAKLTASSSCTDGTQACVAGGFAQCVGGKFEVTQCSAGTQCFALPLVNKAGTSITCDTASDAAARIAVTGVSGGVDGSS